MGEEPWQITSTRQEKTPDLVAKGVGPETEGLMNSWVGETNLTALDAAKVNGLT